MRELFRKCTKCVETAGRDLVVYVLKCNEKNRMKIKFHDFCLFILVQSIKNPKPIYTAQIEK